ncbi:MAG: ATP-binding cassette domain-containing protein, partial [Actinomycetota bacterium]|nr:ATP-binding cassette domain-containing protein [Actinomycetota bacterium]
LLKPNEGSVRFNNELMTDLSPYRRAKLGLGRTFQRLELFPSLSVEENIQVAAEIRGEWFPSSLGTSSVISSVQQVMKLTGLDSIASKSVAEIPTGKARLVELARTVVQGPSMLLLDEPASGQNENETEEFAQILKILNTEGITILLVEHDMSLVMDVCDKVFVLDFGTLIADGTTDEIQNNPVVIDAYLGGTNG